MLKGFSESKVLLVIAGVAGLIATISSARLMLAISESAVGCVSADSVASCGGLSVLAWTAAGAFFLAVVAIGIRWIAMAIARAPFGVLERIAVASVLIAILGIGILAIRAGARSDAAALAIFNLDEKNPVPDSTIDPETQGSPSAARKSSPDPMIRHPFPEVPQSRKGLAFETDPFKAESVAEQEWLDRNGYPNAEQWVAYSTAGDIQLEAAALAGDKSADAMFAQRQLIHGDEAALERMLTAGADGNMFALELLAATLIGPKQDPVAGYAMSRVVEMRGNVRIGFVRDAMFNTPLSPQERIEAEQEAVQIYQTLLRLQRKIRGGDSPAVDVRPIDG